MHQRIEQEDLMEIEKLSFPRQDCILCLLKGARGGIYPHPLGAGLDYVPDHAHRGFQTFQEGIFGLREIGWTGLTFVKDTATMILGSIGRMRLNIRRVAYRALQS